MTSCPLLRITSPLLIVGGLSSSLLACSPADQLEPRLEVRPHTVNFGAVKLNGSVSREISIRSLGSDEADIRLSLESSDGDAFGTALSPERIPPRNFSVRTVTFSPKVAGVDVLSGEEIVHSVSLNGVGMGESSLLRVTPGRLDFDNVIVGSASSQVLTLTNMSQARPLQGRLDRSRADGVGQNIGRLLNRHHHH